MGRPKGSKNGQLTLVAIVCKRCSKTFYRNPSTAQTSAYCSKECHFPERATATCKRCSKEYLPDYSAWGLYCSMECRQNRVEKECPQCHKVFAVRASKASRYTYCSLDCRKAASTSVLLTCKQCGKQFKRFASQAHHIYCSYECEFAYGRTTITCAYCGKEKTIPRYRVLKENTRCCSNRCAVLLRTEEGFTSSYIGWKLQTGHRTDIEAMTEKVLVDLNIPYLFEHKVRRYRVDFALPTLGIALECDGWHHRTEKGRAHDAVRDAVLTEEGWNVIHVEDRLIRQDARAAIMQVLGM